MLDLLWDEHINKHGPNTFEDGLLIIMKYDNIMQNESKIKAELKKLVNNDDKVNSLFLDCSTYLIMKDKI